MFKKLYFEIKKFLIIRKLRLELKENDNSYKSKLHIIEVQDRHPSVIWYKEENKRRYNRAVAKLNELNSTTNS